MTINAMNNCSRREFLRRATVGAGALALGVPALSSQAASSTYKGSDIVPLGRTGIKVSRLAQGTGFNGGGRASDHTRLGPKGFDTLIRHGMDQGVRFLDMADLYGTHPYVRDTVKGLNRDKYVLLSKIWVRKENWCTPSGGAVEELDRFRKELGVDVVDVCLIHCMTDSKWTGTYERVRDELSSLKEKGVVRAVGVSCHDFGALKVAATHPWVDVIFARINHKGGSEYIMDGSVEEVAPVLKQARQNGKAVVGMKIFGAGKLVKPEEKDASLNYVFKNDLVDAITVGMLKTEQVDDTLARMAKVGQA
jgi:aryl-alcohol dehydrogenase-like predicted oxidoreductase